LACKRKAGIIVMDRDILVGAVRNGSVEWRRHALERMLERSILRKEVKEALLYGEIIESYQSDRPFESALFLKINREPLHVVASLDEERGIVYVITAYRPDAENFEDDYKTRRRNAN